MKIEMATPAQRAAIESNASDILALAGPGAGKTATIVARITQLIDSGVQADQIVGLSFTNAAAGELSRRLELRPAGGTPEKEDPGAIELGHLGTLHSFALRILKEYGSPYGYGERIAVISTTSAEDLLASKAQTLGCKAPMKDLLALKQLGRPPRGERLNVAQTVIATYLDDLKEAGVVDYDALLHEFLGFLTSDHPECRAELLKLADRFRHLIVDEVQDSSPIDWKIYDALPIENCFLVGDSDQAIFGFRGGSVAGLVEFSRRPKVEVFKLEDNFRSATEICAAAQAMIEYNRLRVRKQTISACGPGGLVTVHPPAENEGAEIGIVASMIRVLLAREPKPSIAVLARTNAIARGFANTLKATGIGVSIPEVSQLPRDWTLARSYVELLVNPENDSLAFFYLVALFEKKGALPAEARSAAHGARRAAASVGKSLNRANIGIGVITSAHAGISALYDQGVSRESLAIAGDKFRELPTGASLSDLALALAEVRERVKKGDEEGVAILTMHSCKGREFDVVFLTGFEDEACPGRALKAAEPELAIEEERRLAYVAVTRARRELHITTAASRVTPWKEIVKRTPSRFIRELTE